MNTSGGRIIAETIKQMKIVVMVVLLSQKEDLDCVVAAVGHFQDIGIEVEHGEGADCEEDEANPAGLTKSNHGISPFNL